MLGHSHMAIGVATWLAFYYRPADFGLAAPLLQPSDSGSMLSTIPVVALAALSPDLDHPRAALAQWRLAGLRLFWPAAALTHAAFGHRGALHSPAAAALVWWGCQAFVGPLVGLPGLGGVVAWGFVSHLLADMCTKHGVPLLYPLTSARFGLPSGLAASTGSPGEGAYLLAICLGLGWYTFYW